MHQPPVQHSDGREIPIMFLAGMYRADFDGEHFCAQTWEGVVYGLGKHHSISVVVPKVIAKPKEPHEIVRHSADFSVKQNTLHHLHRKANEGCEHSRALVERMAANKKREQEVADAIAADFRRTDKLSRISGAQIVAEANRVVAKLKKQDLAYITHNELTQHVPDVVVRNGVMRLLVERFSFDGA